MPIYKNNDTEQRALPGIGLLAAGESRQCPYYIPLVPGLAAYFSLEEDDPAPVLTLVDGSIPGTAVTGDYGLCMYPTIRINNKSGAELTVKMNGDTTNVIKMPAGEIIYLKNSRDINSLTFSGTGSIQVVAFKKAQYYESSL